MDGFIKFLNENQGLLDFTAIIFAIPLGIITGILTENFLEKRKLKILVHEFKKHLFHELSLNLRYCSQLLESHQHNLSDWENSHLPYNPPRLEMLEIFMKPDYLNVIDSEDQGRVIESYVQMKALFRDFKEWEQLILYSKANNARNLYEIRSELWINYSQAALHNMFYVWIKLVEQLGGVSRFDTEKKLFATIQQGLKDGENSLYIFKTSTLDSWSTEQLSKFSTVYCWENDSKKLNIETISIAKTLE
jgi:hypothetical protein